jgi:hypothetical protein
VDHVSASSIVATTFEYALPAQPVNPNVDTTSEKESDQCMASLSDLVTALSKLTNVPKSTVFAYGRFARESGKIAQRGQGRAAAKMDPPDAANLLIALGGTSVTREAGDAIDEFRPLRGAVRGFVPSKECASELFKWLAPLGKLDWADDLLGYKLESNFGSFLEFLIAEAANGGLMTFMQSIPAGKVEQRRVEIGPATLRKRLFPEYIPPGNKIVGEDVGLDVFFFRNELRAEVEFTHRFDSENCQPAFRISFAAPRSKKSAWSVSAKLTQDVIFMIGLLLTDQLTASSVSRHRLAHLYKQSSVRTELRPKEKGD